MTPAEQTDARWARIEHDMRRVAEVDSMARIALSQAQEAIALSESVRAELWNEALELLRAG